MKFYTVRGGGVTSLMWAITDQAAKEGFSRATGVHYNNVTADIRQDWTHDSEGAHLWPMVFRTVSWEGSD